MCMGKPHGTTSMLPTLTSFPYRPACGGLYRLLPGGCRDARGLSLCSLLAMCTLACWLPARARYARIEFGRKSTRAPPARLLTRTDHRSPEHVRGQMHPRCLCAYSLRAIEKRKSRTLQWMRANACVWQHFFVRFTTLLNHYTVYTGIAYINAPTMLAWETEDACKKM